MIIVAFKNATYELNCSCASNINLRTIYVREHTHVFLRQEQLLLSTCVCVCSYCPLPLHKGGYSPTELKSTMAQIRQNYHEDCEAGINRQINLELYASYVYMSMVSVK